MWSTKVWHYIPQICLFLQPLCIPKSNFVQHLSLLNWQEVINHIKKKLLKKYSSSWWGYVTSTLVLRYIAFSDSLFTHILNLNAKDNPTLSVQVLYITLHLLANSVWSCPLHSLWLPDFVFHFFTFLNLKKFFLGCFLNFQYGKRSSYDFRIV